MQKYLLTEKGIEINFKKDVMTIEEIFAYFEPDEELNEEYKVWKQAKEENTIESLTDYIENHVNNNDGMHYHDYKIEEWNC